MEGAKYCWQTSLIQESLPKVIHDNLPVIWLKPNNKVNINDSKCYKCPVYKTSLRRGILSTTGHSTNYVFTILVPSEKSEEHWIKRSNKCYFLYFYLIRLSFKSNLKYIILTYQYYLF